MDYFESQIGISHCNNKRNENLKEMKELLGKSPEGVDVYLYTLGTNKDGPRSVYGDKFMNQLDHLTIMSNWQLVI